MAIKFYGGHQLNPKTQLFGTKTALRTIEVDESGNAITQPATYTVVTEYNGHKVYVYETDNMSGTPTVLEQPTDPNFARAAHSDDEYIYVTGLPDGSNPVLYIYDISDLSAAPVVVTPPPSSQAGWGVNTFAARKDQFISTSDKIYISNYEIYWGNDPDPKGQGVVYVYDKNDWTAAPVLLNAGDNSDTHHPSNLYHGREFGGSMKIYGSNLYITRGFPGENAWDAGIFVYDVNDLTATPSYFDANDNANGALGADSYGHYMAVTENNVIVTAHNTDGSENRSGAIYIYDRSDLTAEPTVLYAPNELANDGFGNHLESNDNYLFVSRYNRGTHDTNSLNGLVEVYDINTFAHVTTISPPASAIPADNFLSFGLDVVAASSSLIINGYQRTVSGLDHAGSIFIYNLEDLSADPTEIVSPSPIENGFFGSTFTVTSLPSVTTPTSQVSLHLNGTDSGIVDSSSNSHSVTTNGNVAVISGSPHDSTTSMSFDGSGDYISIADHDDFNFGSGDFTVEMWINAATQSTNWPGIFSGSDYNSAGSASLRFDNIGHDNKLFLYTNGLGDPALTTTNTLSHNTWHHIALVRSGTSLSFYVNGTQDGTTTISSGQTFDFSVGEFRIGRGFDVDGGNAYFAGKIADVRAIKGSAVVPTAAPTSALTGSAGSQVVFAELSTTDVKTSYPPVIDGLSVSASNSQDTWSHGRATMSFTSGKYYWEAIPTGPGLIGFELDTADGNRTYHNAGTDTLSARSYNGGMIFKDGVKVIQGQTGWTDGDVVGIAVDGDTGDVQFYVNGVAQAGMSINTGWGSDKVKIPSYGVYKNGADNFSWLFNFGAGGFAYSAPEGYQALGAASPITASLLISGNGGVSDASSSSHTLTLNGDVTTALGTPYTSGNVITFDGNGDFAHISNADFSYGTGDFTIEAWINSDDVTASGPRNIFTQRSQGGPVLRLWNSKLHYMRGEGQNALYSAENLLTAGQWHHVALVRSSGVVSIYLDGTSVASQAETYDFSSLTEVYVGSYGSQYEFFDGEIADFRITKAAVYTENFSVPTATLGDYPPPPVRYYKTEIIPPAPTVTFTGNATDSAELAIDDTISLNAAAVGMGYHSTSFTVGQPMIMEMHLWGAGGGGTKRSSNYTGGYGGYSTGRYTFVPGVEYQVVVGGGGEGGSQDPSSNTAYGALATGGGANEQSTGSEFDGGAGGGYTGVFISEVTQASALIIAGGGGGGSGDVATGGAGGGLNGGNGSNGGRGGLGGSQTAGGSGSGGPGSALQGGTGLGVGAGGGGGYFGGAGGIASGPGAGGGGSGFISSELTDASTGGLDFNAPYRTDSAGLGGANGQNGVGGLLVLRRIS